MNSSDLSNYTPRVGIFWIVGLSIIKLSQSTILTDPSSDGFKTFGIHSDQWDEVKLMLAPELRRDSYTYYDRGRVIYNVNTGYYEIYLPSHYIHDEDTINEIVKSFSLTMKRYRVVEETHYNRNRVMDAIDEMIELDS